MKNTIKIAYSPCPNDTFIFYKLAHNKHYRVNLHDIDLLNSHAFEETYDVSKMSFFAWLNLYDKYQLLNTGSALGKGCGPILITKNKKKISSNSSIAIPGKYTTANLLYRMCYGTLGKRIYMPYDKIMNALETNQVDAAVIIHEGRFIFEQRGFIFVKDLGEWWENETSLPIPLGCIGAKKNLGKEVINKIEQDLLSSIEFAYKNKKITKDYIKNHAQEMDDIVIENHINLYVNNFTMKLNKEAFLAIKEMKKRANKLGLIK